MRMEKICIVISSYNQAEYIKETIDSVKGSTYKDFICVIVNDGSTDNSEEIILNEISGDSRFRYFKNDNHGLAYSRNFGIRQTDTKYILCLDSDDKISPTYIENGVKYLDEHDDVMLYYGNARLFYDDGNEKEWELDEFSYNKLLQHNIIYSSSIYRRRGYDKCGGYDDSMRAYEDWEFLVRMLYPNEKVHKSDDVVFFYRRHEGSMDNVARKHFSEYKDYVMNKNKHIYDSLKNLTISEDSISRIVIDNDELCVNEKSFAMSNCKLKCDLGYSFYGDIYLLRWICDNCDLKEYIHVTKSLNKNDSIKLNDIFNKSEVALRAPNYFENFNVRDQYKFAHNINDLMIVGLILEKGFPIYYNTYEQFVNNRMIFSFDTFIMKKNDFNNCVNFIFTVIDLYLKVVGNDINGRIEANKTEYIKDYAPNNTVEYQYQIGKYLAERLFNVFILTNFKKIKIL